MVAPWCREGILPHQEQWPCWLSQLSWLKATLTATGLATPMATNQCPAGQKQQSLHTLGQGGSLPPASLAVGIRGWKEHLAMSPALLQALAWGGESQQCHRVRKSPAWLGSLGSLVPAPLCPRTQHGTATPTQLREFEPTPACPSCCRARGHPPGTVPPRWPACDRVPWPHSALERVEGEPGAPRKLLSVLRAPRGQPRSWHGHSAAPPALPPALHAQPNVLGPPTPILRLPLDAPGAGTAGHCVFCHPLCLSSAASQGTRTL